MHRMIEVGSRRSVSRIPQTPEFENEDQFSPRCRSLVIETLNFSIVRSLTL